MNMWGYVILAYSIVWGTVILYTLSLKRRYRAAERELERLARRKEA
jgi:CcmD family protein